MSVLGITWEKRGTLYFTSFDFIPLEQKTELSMCRAMDKRDKPGCGSCLAVDNTCLRDSMLERPREDYSARASTHRIGL